MKEADDLDKEFKSMFHTEMRTSKYSPTDGSKMENKPFVGFA
jgi:hypothetical protein